MYWRVEYGSKGARYSQPLINPWLANTLFERTECIIEPGIRTYICKIVWDCAAVGNADMESIAGRRGSGVRGNNTDIVIEIDVVVAAEQIWNQLVAKVPSEEPE